MHARFSPHCFEMFFFMSFLCVLLPPSDLQSIANDKNPNSNTPVPTQSSSSMKIIPSKPQTNSQNTILTKHSPAASEKVGQDQVLVSHSQSTLAFPIQTSNQRDLGDASHTSGHSPVKLLILDTCIEKDKQGDTTNQTQGHSQEVDLEPGSSLILTHKISVIPESCAGSCESEFSALQKRLERLEMEVSTLRRKCGGPESTCPSPQQGGGENGDECPDDCNDQGRCEKGKCVCFPGFSGHDCSAATCPPGGCGHRGRCVRGKCECNAGFSGVDCTPMSCPGNCSSKGRCVQGRCICHPGFTGPDCSRCKDGHTGTECESDSSRNVITTMTIETVTMKLTPGNDTIKEKIHGKLDKTILSKSEEKKNPQRTSRRGEGRGEMESATKTKVGSDLKPDTIKSHSKVDLGLKSNTTKSYKKVDMVLKSNTTKLHSKVDLALKSNGTRSHNKLDLGLKLNTTKSQPKLDSGLKSNTTKSQRKLDSGLKSNTTKSYIKLDLGSKSNTTKTQPKLDLGLKSNTTKLHTKVDLGLKSNTTKSHKKADSDLKPGTTKENEGFEFKQNVMVKKPTIVHSNTSRSGQMGHRVLQAILHQPKRNIQEHQTKARKLDSKLQTKEDDKRPKSGIKMSVDVKQESANQTVIKPGKLIYRNISQASAFVNRTNVELKGKGSLAKATDRTEPGKVTEKMVSAVKNTSKIVEKKILQKANLSQSKVNRTQTTGDHPQTRDNQGYNLRKSEVVPVNDTGSSTLALGNRTALNNSNAGSVEDGISSVNLADADKAPITQGIKTAASKGSENERLKMENNINATSTWKKSASTESETLPRFASKKIHTRNGTRPTLEGPHHPSRGPQHGSSDPKMQSQLIKEEKRMRTTGSHGLAASNISRDGQRTQEMQRDITNIQTDVPNKMRFQAEVKRNNSSITKLKEASTKIRYNSTLSHTVNSGKVDIHPDSRMETNRSSSSTQNGEVALISFRVKNITSRGFTIIWEAPQRMFKNFTLTRRDYRTEMEEEDEIEENKEEEENEGEEQSEGGALGQKDGDRMGIDQSAIGKGVGHRKISHNSSTVHALLNPHNDSRTKSHVRRFTQVIAGSARSWSFRNLHPQSRYSVSLYGTSPGLRSKIHHITVTTAPEPPTDLLFSDVTHSSLYVSWTKPRKPVDHFKVTYTNTENGKPVTVTADSQHSSMLLSQLSPGSSYKVRVFSMKGLDESDPITGLVVTVPDPPTFLQTINITSTNAVLQWAPALAKVDRYIVVYGSEKVPNLTITVPGNAAVLEMKDLQSATVYHVTVTSQLDSLQSTAANATFTTAEESGWRWEHRLIASQVTPRSAVLSWRVPSGKVTGYKLSYQTAGQEMKEMILGSTVIQHRLKGLLPMSKYTAKIQAARAGHYSAPISIEFNTGSLRFPFPADCSQELLNGMRHSGEVLIYPSGSQGLAMRVYCDMNSDGGGWTVFQRRMNGRADFFRGWNDYSKGFGNLSEEFWLGNEVIHSLTSLEPMLLRVDLVAGPESAFARYSSFSIDSQRRFYTINLSGYSGTAGDSMQYHNGRPFSTRDRDPKPVLSGCAKSYRGGWWYKDCHEANLNGLYDINTNHQGVIWTAWKGRDFSIPFTEMKIRPQSFIPQTQE